MADSQPGMGPRVKSTETRVLFERDVKNAFPENVQWLQSSQDGKPSLPSVFPSDVQILEEGHFPKQHLLQNRSIAEWTSHHVARWLVGIHLEHHIPEFTAQNINGEQLLQLESPELKASYRSQQCLKLGSIWILA